MQVFITFETYYIVFYTLTMLATRFYKGFGGLLYPVNLWGLEIAQIVIFFGLQLMRLDLGKRANRNEHTFAIKALIVYTLLAMVSYIYLSMMTTYVLTIDIGLGVIGVFFTILELVLSIMAYCAFKNNSNNY